MISLDMVGGLILYCIIPFVFFVWDVDYFAFLLEWDRYLACHHGITAFIILYTLRGANQPRGREQAEPFIRPARLKEHKVGQ